MIDTTVGRLFKTGDSDDLAKQVNALLADKPALESLSAAGRERILAKYTYEHNATKFLEIYESIIN
jgi:spore maturation protein CgeB